MYDCSVLDKLFLAFSSPCFRLPVHILLPSKNVSGIRLYTPRCHYGTVEISIGLYVSISLSYRIVYMYDATGFLVASGWRDSQPIRADL